MKELFFNYRDCYQWDRESIPVYSNMHFEIIGEAFPTLTVDKSFYVASIIWKWNFNPADYPKLETMDIIGNVRTQRLGKIIFINGLHLVIE